jgi:hypothetical protein
MKVKALKLFGDGKRLYKEGEIAEMTSAEIDILNSISDSPLVEIISGPKSKGADEDGHINNTGTSKSKTRNKHDS